MFEDEQEPTGAAEAPVEAPEGGEALEPEADLE